MKKQTESIRKEFRRSAEARYMHRLHGVLLVLNGLSTVAAGKLMGDPQRTVAAWVNEFQRHGLRGLCDKEKSGRPAALDTAQMKSLKLALRKAPGHEGLESDTWTGALVSAFLKKSFGVNLTVRHSRRLLQSLQD